MSLPIEKNGVILLGKVEEDGSKHITIDYKGFQTDFEGKTDFSYDEIEAYKNGVLITIEKIFDMLPELEKRRGEVKDITFEDLFPQDYILNQYMIPKRNRQGFVENKKFPCSLPKSENGKIVVIAMNINGCYVRITIDSEDFSFNFNEDTTVCF